MLNKQPIDISFAGGLDTKTDPFRVNPGKFLTLQNSIFDKAGRLTKRNGYQALTALPDDSNTFLTTFNGNLTAVGTSLNAYLAPNKSWSNKGTVQPITLSTLPLIRNNQNQTYADTVVSSNGFVCTVYASTPSSGTQYYYAVADSTTGQNILPPVLISAAGSGVSNFPKVFLLGGYFLIIFGDTSNNLEAIGVSTTTPTSTPVSFTITPYTPSPAVYYTGGSETTYTYYHTAWDAYVYSNVLYLAFNSAAGSQHIGVLTISSTLTVGTPISVAGGQADDISVTVDSTNPSNPFVWVSYTYAASHAFAFCRLKTFCLDSNLAALTGIIDLNGGNFVNLTSVAYTPNGSNKSVVAIYVEQANFFTFTNSQVDFVQFYSVNSSGTILVGGNLYNQSAGLASKAVLYNNTPYVILATNGPLQPTYFLVNTNSTTGFAQTISRFAYENGGGYVTNVLTKLYVDSEGIMSSAYLFKDLLTSVNKTQGATQVDGIYAQLGVNLITFNLQANIIDSQEIGSNLNFTGGFISGFDGYVPTEQNFFLYPENLGFNVISSGGSIDAGTYYYVVVYEWADNQGNVFKSAPSVPTEVTVSTSGSSVNIFIPNLTFTYKIATPPSIVVYRWSTAQQIYYALNSAAEGYPSSIPYNGSSQNFYDTKSDAQIIGNPILYTTGGVIENTAPPASSIMTLFNNRLWLVDAEDPNLLYFSKQVIEATPVEMSDLLTLYVPPTTSSQGSTGPITALAPMDDKLIVFKANALGYINGTGPDNTGSNSQYSDFILITSVVGCINPKSIVITPQGLMFQSNKGIWLLGRDLSTQYIGAPVESLTTGATVRSAVNIPGTNQVRFALDTEITLMYDYYFAQWGTFTNVPAVSSTVYNGYHTYINSAGQVLQESPGSYLDNTSPVLMGFTTGWMALSGLQGYERFYSMFLLGQYITPFKLSVGLSYDYNSSLKQQTIVTPKAPNGSWGSGNLYGDYNTWGGPSNVFEARVFPTTQKCESFQVSINEIYDPQYGIAAGAGLTLSGLELVVGMKKGYRTSSAKRSFG